MLDQHAPDANTPINQSSTSEFVNCYFKNRYADESVEDLGQKCLPTGIETDWVEIRDCIAENATVTDIFGTVTAAVADDIKADGFVVRIGTADSEATINRNAKTNLRGEICKALGVRNNSIQ